MRACGVVVVLLTAWCSAAEQKALPAGQTLLGRDDAWTLVGQVGQAVKVEKVAVSGQPFTQALRISSSATYARSYDVQLKAACPVAVKKGDVVLATFWGRTIESREETGETRTAFVFEQNGPPHDKSIEHEVGFGKEWTKVSVPFVIAADYPAGGAQMLFRLGYKPQTFELGGVEVVNYGKQVKLSDLPSTGVSYPGREANAPWRQAAAERIEKLRKGDLTVVVTDAAGKPIAGASVGVHMRRHAFGFGSAVQARMMVDPSADGEKYREVVKKFSRVVFESDLKWPYWNKQEVAPALAWLKDQNIDVRGHCLVWPSWQHTAKGLRELKDDPAALRKRVNDHITEIVSTYRGQLVDWDVINEVYTNHDVVDVLGQSCMVEWFKLARQADPNVNLYINDYSILTGGGTDTAHQDAYEKTIRYLIEQGAPIQGIGLQSHFGSRLTGPEKLLKILDRFAATGLRLQSTEFDINITDEQCQGDYLRDFMTTLFSHPAVDGIVMWGFWEGRHWRPEAALYRKDWSVKPNGQAWLDLVTKQWWTDVTGRSNGEGRFMTRGFAGEYEVEVSAGGKNKQARVQLPTSGQTVKVVLE